jgi:hypothetical protein
MACEDTLLQKVREAIKKDYAYLAYHLPYGQEKGFIVINGEKIETEPYCFTGISQIVRKAFEQGNKVHHVRPIGFRGEIFVSEKKELVVFATGSAGLIEYTVRLRDERRR